MRQPAKYAVLKDGELKLIGTCGDVAKLVKCPKDGIPINVREGKAKNGYLIIPAEEYEKNKDWAYGTASVIYHLYKYGNTITMYDPVKIEKDIPFKVIYYTRKLISENNRGKVKQYWVIERV